MSATHSLTNELVEDWMNWPKYSDYAEYAEYIKCASYADYKGYAEYAEYAKYAEYADYAEYAKYAEYAGYVEYESNVATKHTEPGLPNQNYWSKQSTPGSVVPLAMFSSWNSSWNLPCHR